MFRKQQTAKGEGQPGDTRIPLLPFTGFYFTAETLNSYHLNPSLLMMTHRRHHLSLAANKERLRPTLHSQANLHPPLNLSNPTINRFHFHFS